MMRSSTARQKARNQSRKLWMSRTRYLNISILNAKSSSFMGVQTVNLRFVSVGKRRYVHGASSPCNDQEDAYSADASDAQGQNKSRSTER